MVKKARIDKRQTKPDSGTAIVDAKMSTGEVRKFPISESVRDALNKRPHHTERVKPFDPNTATTNELQNRRYSGFRINHFTNQVELWCLGIVAGQRRLDLVEKNPRLLADLHEEAFSTNGSIITADLDTHSVKNVTELKKTLAEINRRLH